MEIQFSIDTQKVPAKRSFAACWAWDQSRFYIEEAVMAGRCRHSVFVHRIQVRYDGHFIEYDLADLDVPVCNHMPPARLLVLHAHSLRGRRVDFVRLLNLNPGRI